MNISDGYKIQEFPGFLGFTKKETHQKWDDKFGEGNWELAWIWGSKVIDQRTAVGIYEYAYHKYLDSVQGALEWLVENYSEVYDTHIGNIDDGVDYFAQDDRCTHLHDISVRRYVKTRYALDFKGDRLLQIRQPHTEGYYLGPGFVPFHKPEYIVPANKVINYGLNDKWEETVGNREPWWQKGSIEDFYQQNKVLLVNSPHYSS